MRPDGNKVEIDIELLDGVTPFILVTNERMVVTWASQRVLKRARQAVGMDASEVIAWTDPPEELTSHSVAQRIGRAGRLTLLHGKRAVPLRGRWVSAEDGFLLLHSCIQYLLAEFYQN